MENNPIRNTIRDERKTRLLHKNCKQRVIESTFNVANRANTEWEKRFNG